MPKRNIKQQKKHKKIGVKNLKLIFLILAIVVIAVVYNIDEKYNNYVVKIDENRISVGEYKTYLKLAKAHIEDNYTENFGEEYAKSIWTSEIENMPAEQYAKELAYKNVIKDNICVEKAKSLNIKLSSDDIKKIEDDLNDSSLLKDLTRKNITKEEYRKIKQNEKTIELLKERLLANTTVSRAEIDNYIKEHGALEKTYVIKRIIFKTTEADDTSEDSINDKKKIYETAEEVLEKIANNENFESLSIEYSDYETNYKPGEDFEIVMGKDDNPKLEEAIANLKVGQTSKIIETAHGYEIVKLERIIDPSSRDYRSKIEKTLLEEKKAKEFEEEYKKWENLSAIEINKSVYNSITI